MVVHLDTTERTSILNALKTLIPYREALLEAGIVKLETYYRGEGDSGDVEDTSAYNSNEDEIKLEGDFQPVTDICYDIASSILDLPQFCGWEINDGASGTVTIDVKDDGLSISHLHNEYYTESNQSEYSYSLDEIEDEF